MDGFLYLAYTSFRSKIELTLKHTHTLSLTNFHPPDQCPARIAIHVAGSNA